MGGKISGSQQMRRKGGVVAGIELELGLLDPSERAMRGGGRARGGELAWGKELVGWLQGVLDARRACVGVARASVGGFGRQGFVPDSEAQAAAGPPL